MRKLTIAIAAWLLATSMAVAQIVTGSVPNTFVNGTIIDATQVNADYSYIITQVNANAAKNGVNSDITALTALSTPIPITAGGSINFVAGTVGGTANAVTISGTFPNISSFSLTTGYKVTFKVGTTNSAATTLAVGGTAATSIFRRTPSSVIALTGGELVAGQYVTVTYDGVRYVMDDASWPFFAGGAPAINTTATLDNSYSGKLFFVGGSTNYTLNFPNPTTSPATPWYYIANANTGVTTLSTPSGVFDTPGTYGASTFALPVRSTPQLLLAHSDATNWFVGQLADARVPPFTLGRSLPGANSLHIANNAVTPNTQIDVTAGQVTMSDGTSQQFTNSYGTCTINLAVNGAGGLDTGAVAAATWYYIVLIGDGVNTSCLASASLTPTMPAGYSFRLRVGAMKTDAGSILLRTTQEGRYAQYTLTTGSNTTAYRTVISGPSGTCSATASTWTGTTVRGVYTPSTALAVNAGISMTSTNALAAGPSNVPGPYTSQPLASNSIAMSASATFNFDTDSLYYCGTLGAALTVMGWIDHINAN